MIVFIKPAFVKDLKKVPVDIRLETKNICSDVFSLANSLKEIKGYSIKPIVGFKNYYRLRLGDYRIGFKMESDSAIFMRIKHRKEIYRLFP